MDAVLVRTIDDAASLMRQMYALCGQIETLDTLYEGAPAMVMTVKQISSRLSYE